MARSVRRRAAPPDALPLGTVGIRIRMYRVGFGDFFLMSVPAEGGFAHILIDCGVHAHDIKAMPAALAQMHKDTGGALALVIATHRHADHISGFASGKEIFAGITVERVWMSWFEDPADRDAAAVQARLTAVALRLQAALAARSGPDDQQFGHMAGNILGELGATGGVTGNAVALGVLHAFRTRAGTPTPVDYYAAGNSATLPPVLAAAGLTAEILGPPTNLELVAKMDNKAHQFLTALDAQEQGKPVSLAPFAEPFQVDAFPWPPSRKPLYAPEMIRQHVDELQPDVLAAAADSANNAVNNQSLVVLFRFQGKSLLFCGDAQWGNWANFLFGTKAGAGSTELTATSRAVLGALDFYKVGHHGSTNATPIDVVNALKRGCAAMCSTDPGAYGDPFKGTEVPRIPLLDALGKATQGRLARSDQVGAGNKPAVDAALAPLTAAFVAAPQGYIDHLL